MYLVISNCTTSFHSVKLTPLLSPQLFKFDIDIDNYIDIFYLKILIIVQRDATQSSHFIILHIHSKSFGCQPHPSSRVHKTVTTASGTGHIFCAAISHQRGQGLATLEGGSWKVPEAVVTVLCTPGNGCGWHPKHVEWTRRIINRLLCVASRWTIIDINQRYTEP